MMYNGKVLLGMNVVKGTGSSIVALASSNIGLDDSNGIEQWETFAAWRTIRILLNFYFLHLEHRSNGPYFS